MLVVFPPIFKANTNNFVSLLNGISMFLTVVTRNIPLWRSTSDKKEKIENGIIFCFIMSLTYFFKST